MEATVAEQNRRERPMKDSIEVSGSGRVMQTAYKACTVSRGLLNAEGVVVTHKVPGSFVEFIQRKIDPDNGKIDLTIRISSGDHPRGNNARCSCSLSSALTHAPCTRPSRGGGGFSH